MENERPYVVEMKGIRKEFPGMVANDNVNFSLRQGEIHTLLGENGAGKSTLMNILAGLYQPEAGSIKIHGKPVLLKSPKLAMQEGIGMIHQHFMLVRTQTVTENILLGLDDPKFVMNIHKYEKQVRALGKENNLEVDPAAFIWQLTVGEQQRVEILKMLYRGCDILIMDEPTAVLAPQEIEVLFNTLRTMTANGKSIIFISHKLNEILEIADRVTVLRHGKITAEDVSTRDITREDLASLMVGRKVIFSFDKNPCRCGGPVLDIRNISALNDKGLPALRNVSLHVCSGEIVGIAGVAGNGQTILAECAAGMRPTTEGTIHTDRLDIGKATIKQTIQDGIAYIPEDRHHVATAGNMSVANNVIMKSYDRKPISTGWKLNQPAVRTYAERLKDDYQISIPTIDKPMRLLSGGNIQRAILARELDNMKQLLIAVQPTRGLDVGAIEGIQRMILAQRDAGAGVLLISEELEELVTLSDRIYVMFEGQIMGEILDGDIRKIGLMMTGTRLEDIPDEDPAAVSQAETPEK
ncbi:heme ABC transporter ATP-binding protein [Anaerolineaceae bacterium oral taxon 439]|nr:heme ABC transporter ATP-binding protein [Anaerolineaceae bacterium oral taxon 439]